MPESQCPGPPVEGSGRDLFKFPEPLFMVLCPPGPPLFGFGRAVEPGLRLEWGASGGVAVELALTLPLTDLFRFAGLLLMVLPPPPPPVGSGMAVVLALATVEKATRKNTVVKMEKIVFKIHLLQLS